MKSKLIICSLLTLSIAVLSCKKEETEALTDTTPKEIILPNVPPVGVETYVQPNQQVSMPDPNSTQATAATKPGMNPAHGQPGHRCEIAVGAPLNSTAAKTATAQIPGQAAITQTPMTTTQTPALLKSDGVATTTAPGMNPPHGQEGHRCEIAVGAALPK